MMKLIFAAGGSLAFFAMTLTGANADTGKPVTPGFAFACGSDYARWCGGAGADERALLSCVSRKFAIVAPRCQGYLLIRYAAESCAADLSRYCQGVTPGGGRAVSCLMGNRDRLAPSCLQALETGRRVLAGEAAEPATTSNK